jgi:hypothetical protein
MGCREKISRFKIQDLRSKFGIQDSRLKITAESEPTSKLFRAEEGGVIAIATGV